MRSRSKLAIEYNRITPVTVFCHVHSTPGKSVALTLPGLPLYCPSGCAFRAKLLLFCGMSSYPHSHTGPSKRHVYSPRILTLSGPGASSVPSKYCIRIVVSSGAPRRERIVREQCARPPVRTHVINELYACAFVHISEKASGVVGWVLPCLYHRGKMGDTPNHNQIMHKEKCIILWERSVCIIINIVA